MNQWAQRLVSLPVDVQMLRCQLNTRLVLIEENEHRLRRLCSIVKQLSLLQDTAESDEFRLRSQQLAQDAIREAIKVESFVDCAREQVRVMLRSFTLQSPHLSIGQSLQTFALQVVRLERARSALSDATSFCGPFGSEGIIG